MTVNVFICYVSLLKREYNMLPFIKENAVWLVPIAVAVIGGIFTLLKSRNKTSAIKQNSKNVKNSTINQVGGNQNVNNSR